MDKIKNSPLREAGLRMLVIMVYSVIVALNFKSFVQAGDLFPGGFTGLTRLLQRCAQEYWHITLPFAPLNLLFNAIPAAVSLKLIGKRFTMYSCLAIVFSSFFTDMIPAVPVTEDILLICVFGGLVNGFAISLCLQVRITSGGTDFIAIALAELGNISERRTYKLISGARELPKFLVANPGLNSGFMIPQYTAASIVSQSKGLCMPASVDSIPSSQGQEDHVSMGSNAATKLWRVVCNTERVLAIELFNAAQAIEFRRPAHTSPELERMLADYRKEVPFIDNDEVMYPHIEASVRFLRGL